MPRAIRGGGGRGRGGRTENNNNRGQNVFQQQRDAINELSTNGEGRGSRGGRGGRGRTTRDSGLGSRRGGGGGGSASSFTENSPRGRSGCGGSSGVEQNGGRRNRGDRHNVTPYQRSGRNTRNSAAAQTKYHEGTVIIFVKTASGQSLAHENGLYDFLSRKASMEFDITSKRSNDSGVSFIVANIDQAQAMRAISGIRYKSQKLVIKTSEDAKILGESRCDSNGGSDSYKTNRNGKLLQTSAVLEAIRAFVRSRYNPQDGTLDLQEMNRDLVLRGAKIFSPGHSAAKSDICEVILKIAAEICPEAMSISFMSNGLRTLEPIAALADYFPRVKNLSFAKNRIQNYDDLQALSGPCLPRLRELVLLDNPVRDRNIDSSEEEISYRRILDRVPVKKISFGFCGVDDELDTSGRFPLPARLYDADRRNLEHVYDEHATFSYAAVTTPSPLQRSQVFQTEKWTDYLPASRNMNVVKDLESRTSWLNVGNESIIQNGLLRLPDTKHDIFNRAKFSVDAWETRPLLAENCIYIMLHGEFEEVREGQAGVRKSFDRSFILRAAPPNSIWQIVILSDQLTIRGYNGYRAWKTDLDSTESSAMEEDHTAPARTDAVLVPSTPAASATERETAEELQRRTGLELSISIQCLMNSNWDILVAEEYARINSGNLPEHAWLRNT
ncbi:nuclear mRNA export, poly(A)+RNA binding protein [Haplosporangium sp. Z 767]|nr:nuclear mRNA export, poly(A)+RNA binding protein [Haplosporangium sp. Z 767]